MGERMAKKVFISFNFKERGYKNDMLRLFASGGGKIEATPIQVENDVSTGGPTVIEAEIRRVMDPCCGLIALVGTDAHNSPWIDSELRHADRLGIPKVGVLHPQVRAGLPNSHKYLRVLEWNSQELVDMVRSWHSK